MLRKTDIIIFSALLAAEIPTIAAQGTTTTITETVTLSSADCEAKKVTVREQYAGKEVSEAAQFKAAMDAVLTECAGKPATTEEGKGHHGKGHHHGGKRHHKHKYLHVCDAEWTALKTKFPFPAAGEDEKAWHTACEADVDCKADEEKLKETCKEKAKACMDEAKPIAEALREAMKEENQAEIDAETAKLTAMEGKCPGITQQVKEGCKGKGGKGRGKGGKGRGKGGKGKHGKGRRGAVEKAKGRVRMPVNSFPENPTEIELEVTETAVKKGLATTVGVEPEVVTIEKLSVVVASLRKAMLRALQTTGSRFLDITYAITVDSDAQATDVIAKLAEPNTVAALTQETNAALQADALNFPEDKAPTVTSVETVEEPEVVYEHTSAAYSGVQKGFISTLFLAIIFAMLAQ